MFRIALGPARSVVVSIALVCAACADKPPQESPRVLSGQVVLSADSTAVLIGADTLFTADRAATTMGVEVDGGFRRWALSPDSSRIAFAIGGETVDVGVWTRLFQSATHAATVEGGAVDSIVWSPEGRFVTYQVRFADGPAAVGAYDVGLERRAGHPAAAWLSREGFDVTLDEWIDARRLRVVATAGADPDAGTPLVWDPENGLLAAEGHLEAVADNAPPGAALERDGVFSIDVVGDTGLETIALYRRPDATLGGLVVEQRGDRFRARVTEPLVDIRELQFESWADASGQARLHLIADMNGWPLLMLQLPSSQPPMRAIGLFHVDSDGQLRIVEAQTSAGALPALFYDGRAGGTSSEVGVIDLDEDGTPEIVGARARLQGEAPNTTVRWRATVFRWEGRSLVPAPDLAAAALERIRSVTSGAQEEN